MEMLKRHLIVLKKVMEEGPIGIMRVSMEADIPSHKARYSLRVLEHAGLIEPTQQGAVATSRADDFMKKLVPQLDELEAMLEELKQLEEQA